MDYFLSNSQTKFWKKRIWFINYINKNIYDKSSDPTTLIISRENILEESFNQFQTTKGLILTKPVQIHFIDEVAQDVGGVFREWYANLFDALFSPQYHLFDMVQNRYGKTSYFISHKKARNLMENGLNYYEFIGKIIGKGIFDKNTMKYNLNRILLKHILMREITIEDIKYLDFDVRFLT